MPLAAVVTIIGAVLTVVVLAVYLLRVAMLLRRVDRRLGAITGGLGAVVDKTEPIGQVVGEINRDLEGVDKALQDVLSKRRSPSPQPWGVAMPQSGSTRPSPDPAPRSHPGLARAMPRSRPGLAPSMSVGPRPGVESSTSGPHPGVAQHEGLTQYEARTQVTDEPGTPDVVWGVRDDASFGGLAKKFALLAGLAYVGIGVIGFFVTGFNNFTENTNEALLGIFPITPMHNVVHLGVGAVWLLAALVLTRTAAEGVNLAIGGFYVLAAILGYFGVLRILLGVQTGLDAPDFYLHLLTGVVSVLFAGLLGGSRDDEQTEYQDRTYARV